jgi:predicted metal-binding membrane protein
MRTPVLAVTAVAWAGTLAFHPLHWVAMRESSEAAMDSAMASGHGAHTMDHAHMQASHGSLLLFVAGWVVMLAAMMSPLLIGALRHVSTRALPRRRWRATTLLVTAYVVTWTVGGLVLWAVASSAQEGGTTVAIALGVVLVAVWQVSPAKQRCLNRRHRHPPLAAFGRAADVDVLRYGGTHAAWCFGSCWALMLLPLVAGTWHLAVMVLVTLWMWAEEFDKAGAPTWRLRAPVRAARIVAASVRRLLRPARAVVGG